MKGAKTSRPTRPTGPGPERVVLVGVFKKGRDRALDEISLAELGRLVETAGDGVIEVVVGRRIRRAVGGEVQGSGLQGHGRVIGWRVLPGSQRRAARVKVCALCTRSRCSAGCVGEPRAGLAETDGVFSQALGPVHCVVGKLHELLERRAVGVE